MTYIFYSSLPNGGYAFLQAYALMQKLGEDEVQMRSLNKFDPHEVMELSDPNSTFVLIGGDGTLNRFINTPGIFQCNREISYHAGGTGNDFYRDVCEEENRDEFPLTPYLQFLPTAEFDGQTRFFLNGVGAGLDGYCCATVEESRRKGKKPPSYASVALRGLLYQFKPLSATVTVDGVTHWFQHVYIATTMHGRYYGGGVKIAPDRKRSDTRTVTVVVVHSRHRLNVIPIFGTIFKGTHVKYKKYVTVLTGSEIKVSFDRPCPMQVDGEVFPPVNEYRITAACPQEKETIKTE